MTPEENRQKSREYYYRRMQDPEYRHSRVLRQKMLESRMHKGVYMIRNTVTGECYIGSSVHIEKRWRDHMCPSNWARKNSRMYRDFQTYGISCFSFSIIYQCHRDRLRDAEQAFIDLLHPEYNTMNAVGCS